MVRILPVLTSVRSDLGSVNSGLDFGSDDMKMAFFKDGKLQLLLKLMGAERVGERGSPL